MAKYYIAVAYGFDEDDYITGMPNKTKQGALKSLDFDFTYDRGTLRFIEIELENYKPNVDKLPVIKVCPTTKGKK